MTSYLTVLGMRGPTAGHLLHLHGQAGLREGLQGETVTSPDLTWPHLSLRVQCLQLMQKICTECGCVISDVYYTREDGKVVCETDYKVEERTGCSLSRDYSDLCLEEPGCV